MEKKLIGSPTLMLLFRLAYIFRLPVFKIREWPMAEILAWQSFFELAGPLDWEREDWLDARRHAFKYGEEGNEIEDYRFFRIPELPPTPAEEATAELRRMADELAKIGDADGIAKIRKKIDKIKRENYA